MKADKLQKELMRIANESGRYNMPEFTHNELFVIGLFLESQKRAAFNEAYDKFVECEDDIAYTKWLNKVCG